MRGVLALSLLLIGTSCVPDGQSQSHGQRGAVEALIRQHARAWEAGDTTLLKRILHDRARLAYPKRRLDKGAWLKELTDFSRDHTETRIYIHQITVEGADFAVEWQFATTQRESGRRIVVSDAIIGRVQDGRIVLWKEYLDGRVRKLQVDGVLELEEGEEPFPWPLARDDSTAT
ncbi:MAG: nuclear transport factor 2 family protein [Gemmatimonadetes bacterium]|nr:nuclear transport factor 2 family protein [Gemmatimonadota bacterium]